MYHYMICCKLTFDLQKNNKLHIVNLNYYKLIFKNFLKLYFEIKFNIYMHKFFLHHT
jgi:hypothetical protein